MRSFIKWIIALQLAGLALTAAAQTPNCPLRPAPGTTVLDPASLSSASGALQLALTLRSGVDSGGYTHYCFDYAGSDGTIEAPTLRVNPGDKLIIDLTNQLDLKPAAADAPKKNSSKPSLMHDSSHGEMQMLPASTAENPCASSVMTINSTNIHFHGLNIPPVCHQDEVVHTLVQPSTTPFRYNIEVPANEPPGLYWYHPHPHGFTTLQVNGGASGAIIVGGIEKIKPQVAGLPERVLILRQQFLNPGSWLPGPNQLTINFQPSLAPRTAAPTISMQPGEKQFWRVLNASTQAFLALQLWYVTKPQRLEIISLDGVPVKGDLKLTTINLPPAGRAEFIVQAPPANTAASFVTVGFDTGPAGNPNPAQTIAEIVPATGASAHAFTLPAASAPPSTPQRFAALDTVKPTAERHLYFSEATEGSNGPTGYYLTVQGQRPKLFTMDEAPAIRTKVGAVEDWIIENHSSEEHAFHMHQIHFLVMAINGVAQTVPPMQDTVNMPYWDGKGPYPSLTLRMDFRDPEIAGTFVYHCHILDHEDGGMMGKIRVDPN